MSETAACREVLAPFCVGWGMDLGFGGDPIVPSAITFDLPGGSYGPVGKARQILQGDCRDLSFFCDGALDYIYSAHLLEDFTYPELVPIVTEWRRVLRAGGLLVTNCPDQQRFLEHCERTGQPGNDAHKESTFSLQAFRERVLVPTGPWEEVFVVPEFGAYSWLYVARKVSQVIG